MIWNSDVITVSQLKQVIHFRFTILEITYIYVSCGVDYTKESEDRGQKSYKLLKERFPMKQAYTIISIVLILKTPLFNCKAKVSGHASSPPHIIDTVQIIMVPKTISFPFKELYFPSK